MRRCPGQRMDKWLLCYRVYSGEKFLRFYEMLLVDHSIPLQYRRTPRWEIEIDGHGISRMGFDALKITPKTLRENLCIPFGLTAPLNNEVHLELQVEVMGTTVNGWFHIFVGSS